MKKFFIVIGAMCMFAAISYGADIAVTDDVSVVADDESSETPVVTPRVEARKSCDEIASLITYLSGIDTPSSEEKRELSSLRLQQRRNCTKSVGARRTTGRGVASSASTMPVTDNVVVVSDDEIDVAPVPEKTPEEIAAAATAEAQRIAELISNGFCADGTKPNKFGCCTGEKFTDMGNLEFACCPRDGGDCFPPMK